MKGTHVLFLVGWMGTGKASWTETETKTAQVGTYMAECVCTQVMYKATKNMCRPAATQALYVCKGGRGSEGMGETEGMEKEGTHNRLAAPVLMLRPAGPLADLANAIVDRGAGSLPSVCMSLRFCLSACLPASKHLGWYGSRYATRLG